jgi:hypothetical protein
MAIQIRAHLTASPSPATLPRRIDFRQTLRSNMDQENVGLEFAMDPAHEIWFKDGNGQPTKSIPRTIQVSQLDQPVLTRITLMKGPGTGPITLVEIDQTIIDSSGTAIPDSCELGID